MRGTFLKYFWALVVVMDKIGGREEKKEDEHQIGARFEACTWI